MARSSFVSWVRVRADAAVLHDFGNLADVRIPFGVPHAFIDDSHFARAQGWERIEQRLAANFCFVDGVEFHRDDYSRHCHRAEDGPESKGGILVPGGGDNHSAGVGFVKSCQVTI